MRCILCLARAFIAPLSVLAQTPVLLRTFNNPTPATDDFFSSAMAALGNDRVLIGAQYDDTTATNAGAVSLPQKRFQNPWRDWATENALDR